MPIVEKEAQGDVATTFKSALRELSDAQSAVKVRLPKVLGQFAEGQKAFDSLFPLQLGKPPQDLRINDERLLQSSS